MADILIVDDDPGTCALIARLPASQGHQTRSAPHGAAALLTAHAWHPALILMDLSMPVLNGRDAILALREGGDGAYPHS
jgi:CheY-like chemotaxis protein